MAHGVANDPQRARPHFSGVPQELELPYVEPSLEIRKPVQQTIQASTQEWKRIRIGGKKRQKCVRFWGRDRLPGRGELIQRVLVKRLRLRMVPERLRIQDANADDLGVS